MRRKGMWSVLCILILAGPVFGQATATITGLVLDPTGAVIADARIEAVNEATNFVHRTESSTSGNFVLEALPVGSYAVSVQATGFKSFSQRGITLQVNQKATLDVHLEVGSLSEQVTVEANVTKVDTVSGTLREVVDTQRIEGLPLNGRNVLQLQALLPSVVPAGTVEHVGGLGGYAVNGGIAASNNFFLDGGEFVDPYFNAPQFFPNPDALQEFTIQTNASSAEYGRNRSGVVAAVTRSGTNALHGGAFEFLRNTHLNARNFFAASVSPFHQNQFGAYLGGPVKKNKLFFFGSWESYRQSGSPGVSTITALSERERRGDFSELPRAINDPTTGQAFPGNVIPESRISPVSRQFLDKFVPLPNGANRTYTVALKPGRNRDQFLGKVDWMLSDYDRISTRYVQTDEDIICASVLKDWCRGGPYPRKSYVLNHTRTINPTDLNIFVFTYNKTNFAQDTNLRFFWKDFGANIPADAYGYGHEVNVSGRFNAATGWAFIHDRDTLEFSDTYSMVRGNHFLKIGGQYMRHRTKQINNFMGGASMSFNGQFSGDGAADFLIGRIASYRQGSVLTNALRQNNYGLFVQEDWKVNQRLTLNLGIRWDPWPGYTDLDDHLAAFRPGLQSRVWPTAIPGMVFPGDPGIPRTVTGNDLGNFAPRVGFAYAPTRSTRFALRGGYGVYFDHIRSINLNRFPLIQPFVLDTTVTDVSISDPFRGQSPFPYTPPGPSDDRSKVRFFAPASFNSFNEDFVAPYAQQWNMNVQVEPLRDYLLTAAYVGSKSSKLFLSRNVNPALPRPDATVGNIQARRIHPQYAVIEDEATTGYSQYHSLQLSLNKRFSRGFTLLASYTWAKDVGLTASQSEGTQGPRHPLDYRLDKARMGTDIEHRFVTSFVWRLPEPDAWKASALGHLLCGWETTGIVVFQSGTPFTVRAGVDSSLYGIGADTADLVGDPRLDTGRARKDLVAQYFNMSAFVRNQRFSVGTSGINILDSSGVITTDVGINKEFAIRESHRLQFRSEFFNLLNRPNLGGPVAIQNSVNFGRILGTGDPRVIQFGLKYKF